MQPQITYKERAYMAVIRMIQRLMTRLVSRLASVPQLSFYLPRATAATGLLQLERKLAAQRFLKMDMRMLAGPTQNQVPDQRLLYGITEMALPRIHGFLLMIIILQINTCCMVALHMTQVMQALNLIIGSWQTKTMV